MEVTWNDAQVTTNITWDEETSNNTWLPGTAAEEHNVKVTQVVIDTLITAILVLVMFSMGCSVSLTELKKHLLRPVALSIGVGCQFLMMPILGFCIINLLGIQGLHATGVLLASCSPGGTISNVFTYFCEGDISLSVAMTSISGVIALIAMPANLWLYGLAVDTGEAKVPYLMITVTLCITIAPAFAGYLFKYKWPQRAPLVTKYGSILSMVFVVTVLALNFYDKPTMFTKAPVTLYAACLLAPTGLFVAYLITLMLRQPSAIRRTVVIEASMQNMGLALAVASLSFPREFIRLVMVFPALYLISMLITGTSMCLLYRMYTRLNSKT